MRKPITDTPYLSSQLIAYIGNKRALLGFLGELFSDLVERYGVSSFLDPFAGSGAVSRLAKYLGFRVRANDWEWYSYIVNRCHVWIDDSERDDLFGGRGGIEAVFESLNGMERISGGYIGGNYAPRDTESADYRSERLFYTAENAKFIDTVRDEIESMYPGWMLDERELKEKTLLLSSLVYEAATHANTSGVFKAYHKGFGGHSGDALQRIMAPMTLEVPVLYGRESGCTADRSSAASFVRGVSGDLCYLDPPYNGHQYGSNYHLLNTIVLWDKLPVRGDVNSDGSLAVKAGIREDWVGTKSDFCYRDKAPAALKELLDGIDSRFIVMSYNTEGVIPFLELHEILSGCGETELRFRNYVKYRGGRQSVGRKNHNVEFLLVTDRNARAAPTGRVPVRDFLLQRTISNRMKGAFDPVKIRLLFETDSHGIILRGGRGAVTLPMFLHYRFEPFDVEEILRRLEPGGLERFDERLASCSLSDHVAEARFLIEECAELHTSPDTQRLHRYLVRAIRMFTYRKYRDEWEEVIEKARTLAERLPADRQWFARKIDELTVLGTKRFEG